MKTKIEIKKKRTTQQLNDMFGAWLFRLYCLFHTIFNHRSQFGKVYWSNSDCYIEIGKSGYISDGKMFDINKDTTAIKEVIIGSSESIKIYLSEPEFLKIKRLAEEKHISIKDLLMNAIDNLQTSR